MYEAPDRYKRLISARLPGGESAGLAASGSEDETSPLRDVQLISRAQLAGFFASANVIAAIMMISKPLGRAGQLARSLVDRGHRRKSRRDAVGTPPVDQMCRPLGASRADLDVGCRGRGSCRRMAQPSALPLSTYEPGRAGHFRLHHGRSGHRCFGSRRHSALRDNLDGGVHPGRRRLAAFQPAYCAVSAYGFDPLHSWRWQLRCAHRRSLGIPSAQDECRHRRTE